MSDVPCIESASTGGSFPGVGQCVHLLLEAQVERTPDAVAMLFGDRHLTYQELNVQANRLVHHLQKLGVGPEIYVGISMERSLEMVIGLLAILKAGGTYIPLDPTYPRERLAFMLNDAHISVLLTQQKLLTNVPEHSALVVCLKHDRENFRDQSASNPACSVNSANLAYVIYTSGSTGKPKGVAMPHRSLANLLVWHRENLPLAVGAKTLQFTSLSFDVSFQEIFSTLCSGGTLVMITEEVRRDSRQLLQCLRGEGVTRLFLPFVALQQMAETAESYQIVPIDLREVMTAGEQLQVNSSIRTFFKTAERCILYNQYGPTESHVVVTTFKLAGISEDWPVLPPIGRPIARAHLFLLDAHHQPLPVGASGELYIGGDCLARGYLNHPDLTAERFVPNPFENVPGAYLYKTGDLARSLPDNSFEFLGRIDSQVKIRGFRIELGEIEALLCEHPQVQEATVIVRKGERGENILAACLVSAQQPELSLRDLRSFLKRQLPEYMVPSFFTLLDAFPLTPSGKIDRRALSLLTHFMSLADEDEEAYVAARTPLEEIVADIWISVLGIKRVGIHENFFELGGNSLRAMQVVLQIQRLLQIDVPLLTFFDAPTLERFALTLEQMLIADLEEIPE